MSEYDIKLNCVTHLSSRRLEFGAFAVVDGLVFASPFGGDWVPLDGAELESFGVEFLGDEFFGDSPARDPRSEVLLS